MRSNYCWIIQNQACKDSNKKSQKPEEEKNNKVAKENNYNPSLATVE